MSRRKRLIRRTALWCTVPVAGVTAWILLAQQSRDAPYVAGRETEGITRALDRAAQGRETGAALRFTDVTQSTGIDFVYFPSRRTSQLPEDMGGGASWADYDGDGDWDLFLPRFAAPLGASLESARDPSATPTSGPVTDRLYRNRGDGTFEDVTGPAGVDRAHRAIGSSWGDFDADGDPDLLVTTWGGSVLWENRGDGTFVDATGAAGLGEEGFWTGAAWCDFDGDGDLDLHVCGYVEYEPPDERSLDSAALAAEFPFTLNPSSWPAHPNRLWVNRGDGTFEERSGPAGVTGTGKSLGAVWADFDDDGRPDLYVANDVSDNVMYRNRGDGTFEDVSYEAVVADYRGAMGIAVGDWDGDLDADLFITHWVAQENALYSNQHADGGGGPGARMLFVDDADRVGLGQIALDMIGWGTGFADFDSDGLPDLFVANGSTFQDRADRTRLLPMPTQLFRNLGPDEGFLEVGEAAGLRTGPPGVGRGAATCDWDGDGDLDLVVVRHDDRTRFFRNDSDRGTWIKLRLRDPGRAEPIGARVLVHAGGRAQRRDLAGGASYLSRDAPELVVGLGSAGRADSVVVHWPGGGVEVHRDLAGNGTWILERGNVPRSVASASGAAAGSGSAANRSEAPPPRSARPTRTSEMSQWAVVADVGRTLSPEETRRFWARKRDADRALANESWAEAATILEELVRLDPHHEDSLYDLGNCCFELSRWSEAAAAWNRLLEFNPDASRAWVQIGVLHTQPAAGPLFDLGAAARAFDNAAELNPEHSGALIARGEVAFAAGDPEAPGILEAAWRMNPRATSALCLSAYVSWKNGAPEHARELLAQARESFEAERQVRGVAGEGDTRSEDAARARERAARRRLFGNCVATLAELPDPVDPNEFFQCLERELASLP